MTGNDVQDRQAHARARRGAGRALGGGWRARGAELGRAALRRAGEDHGAATAEYAIATLAAVGFAGALVLIMRSDEVRGFLLETVRRALQVPE